MGLAVGAPMSALRGLARRLFTTDPRTLGRLYLANGLLFLLLGGLLMALMRWQWGWPGQPVPLVGGWLFPRSGGAIPVEAYPRLFTLHGLVMVFFAVSPLLLGGLGNFLVPLLIGAPRGALPRLSALSFWLHVTGQALVVASLFQPLGTASAGWTNYPPLSAQLGSPGAGPTLVLCGLLCAGLASIGAAVNLLTTVVRLRAPGMGWRELPATVWGLFFASVLHALFVPVLAVATALLLADRELGSRLFLAGAQVPMPAGEPLAYQHLFWLFGHPEVYVLILPVWGVVTDLCAFFSRRRPFAPEVAVGAMAAVSVMSGLVYGHHLFTAGVSPMLGRAFMWLTLAISLPSGVLAMTWLQTLAPGGVRREVPMLFALGAIAVFGIGGFMGLLLGDVGLDRHLHDTLYVVGHFHLTMAAATFLGLMAALWFWAPKLFGVRLDDRLGRLHFWPTFVLLLLVFLGIAAAGWAGQPRRLFDPYRYGFVAHLLPLNRATGIAAFLLLAAQTPFIWALVRAARGLGSREPNPWQVGTLEWTELPVPLGDAHFRAGLRVHRGPWETFEPAAGGRAFLGQAEPLEPAPSAQPGERQP